MAARRIHGQRLVAIGAAALAMIAVYLPWLTGRAGVLNGFDDDPYGVIVAVLAAAPIFFAASGDRTARLPPPSLVVALVCAVGAAGVAIWRLLAISAIVRADTTYFSVPLAVGYGLYLTVAAAVLCVIVLAVGLARRGADAPP